MVQTTSKFNSISFIFIVMLSSLTRAQTNEVVQDVAQDTEAQFVEDDNHGREGDRWWKNYETVEEHANSFDDQLEMIYTYRVNPFDLTTTTRLQSKKPFSTTPHLIQTTETSQSFNRVSQTPKIRQKEPLLKVEQRKLDFKEQSTLQTPVASEPAFQTSSQFTPPVIPLRRQNSIVKDSAEPKLQVAPLERVPPQPAPLVSPLRFQPPLQQLPIHQQAPQQRLRAHQSPPAQNVHQAPPAQKRLSLHQVQKLLAQKHAQQQPPLAQNVHQQPPLQNIQQQPLAQNVHQQPPLRNVQQQPSAQIVHQQQPPVNNVQQQSPVQNVPQRVFETPQSPDPVTTTVALPFVETEPVTPATAAPSTTRAPLVFVPGPKSPFSNPGFPHNFRSIANAIPLPAYLFQKPNAQQQQKPTSRQPLQQTSDVTTTTDPNILQTTIGLTPSNQNVQQDSIPRVGRRRRPTTQSPVKPNLDDKTLFEVVVPKKANKYSPNENKLQITLLSDSESDGSVPLSAAPSSNEPQRVPPTQIPKQQRLSSRRGTPHALPTKQDTTPAVTNNPFLSPSNPPPSTNENLPRYVRLLNRYSLYDSNQTDHDKRKIQNRQGDARSNVTGAEIRPSSARVFDGEPSTVKTQRRRRPTSGSSKTPSVTDSVLSDSEEVPIFDRSNSRSQRQRSTSGASTNSRISTTTSSPVKNPTTVSSPTNARPERSRRRFSSTQPPSTERQSVETTSKTVPTISTTPSIISKRPLKRGRGFGFHLTSTTTTPHPITSAAENLDQNGESTDDVKLVQDNDIHNKSDANSEAINQQALAQPEETEADNQAQSSGLRRRKFNFKRKSPSFRPELQPAANNLNSINQQENNSSSNISSSKSQPSPASNLSKLKSKSGPNRRPSSLGGSSAKVAKSKLSSVTTTAAPGDTTTKRRFRFKPKVTKAIDTTELPSTTEGLELYLNDTTEISEEIPETTTSKVSIVSRVKPGRGNLFVRPALNSGSAKRSPTVTSTKTSPRSKTSPLGGASTTQSAVSKSRKPFVSRFRTTTTEKQPPIAEIVTESITGDVTTAQPAVISTTKPSAEKLIATTPTPLRSKSRFSNFQARVGHTSPRTSTPIEDLTTTLLTTTTVPISPVDRVAEIADISTTPNRFGKRRRRPFTSQTSFPELLPVDVTTTPTTTTTITTTSTPLNIDSIALLNANYDFNRKTPDFETATLLQVPPFNDETANTNFPLPGVTENSKRRKIRRRKLSQRSTSVLGDLLFSASNIPEVTLATFSTTETGFTAAQSSSTSPETFQSSNITSEKSKALAKKELLEKIALKSSAQNFQQNGFTLNVDEPLIMEADDSGVWFSNPDESSASDNRSPPLAFIPNTAVVRSRAKRIENPEGNVNDEKVLTQLGSQPSKSDGDEETWFSGAPPSTDEAGSIDRKDDTIELETVTNKNEEIPTSVAPVNGSVVKEENPKAIQKSRTATFSVSSSTSVHSETSKRRSSTSMADKPNKQQANDEEKLPTSTKSADDDDDGFRIEDMGPPRLIVIDKVTMRFRDSDEDTTKSPPALDSKSKLKAEQPSTTTTDYSEDTTTSTKAAEESVGRSKNDDQQNSRNRNPTERRSQNRGNRISNTRGTTRPTTTSTSATTEEIPEEITLRQDASATTPETPPPENEAAYKNPFDEVGYFGPEEVQPEAKGALDGLGDDAHLDEGREEGTSLTSDDFSSDEVVAVNVSEHNDDKGQFSEQAPGDEASIWELSPLTDFAGPFSESSSFKVEVRSKAPKLMQMASKRETRTDSEFMKPRYDTLAKQGARLPLFKNPNIQNNNEFTDLSDEFLNKLQAFQYGSIGKLLDDPQMSSIPLNIDTEPLFENNTQVNTATGDQLAVRKLEDYEINLNLDGPTNCNKSERNVCPVDNEYPSLLVETVVKQNVETVRELWEVLQVGRSPSQIYPEDNEEENTKHDLSVCDSAVETIRPGWAREANYGKWMIVVNTPAFPQFIRVELCLRLKKECLFISPYYRSSCTEHHSAHRLVAIDPNNPSAGPVVNIFKFPCGCSCKVEMFHERN